MSKQQLLVRWRRCLQGDTPAIEAARQLRRERTGREA